MTKTSRLIAESFDHSKIRIWNLFGICKLIFGALVINNSNYNPSLVPRSIKLTNKNILPG